MEATIFKVPVSELRPGMYIVDTSPKKHKRAEIYSLEGYLLLHSERESIIKRGYQYAYVRDDPSMDIKAVAVADDISDAEDPVPFDIERREAEKICKTALTACRHVHEQVVKDKAINLDFFKKLFKEMTASTARNKYALSSLLRLKNMDEYTYTHCLNVSVYMVILGRECGVKEEDLPEIAIAGFFHDVGKLFIPKSILNYPGKLSEEKMRVMRTHTLIGEQYLRKQGIFSENICRVALEHHERYSGSGYPYGKQKNEISLPAQFAAISDVYDALCSKRVYKPSCEPLQVMTMLYKDMEEEFEPSLVATFIRCIGIYPSGTLVYLNDNSVAVVTEQNPANVLTPKVVLLRSASGIRLQMPVLLDLSQNKDRAIGRPLERRAHTYDIDRAVQCAYYHATRAN